MAKKEQLPAAPAKKISDEEAQVLAKIGLSQAESNAPARAAVGRYFAQVLDGEWITLDQARAALNILSSSSTSEQKALCNRVLSRYLSQFPVPEPAKAVAA